MQLYNVVSPPKMTKNDFNQQFVDKRPLITEPKPDGKKIYYL